MITIKFNLNESYNIISKTISSLRKGIHKNEVKILYLILYHLYLVYIN